MLCNLIFSASPSMRALYFIRYTISGGVSLPSQVLRIFYIIGARRDVAVFLCVSCLT